jgi:hypothetical protein
VGSGEGIFGGDLGRGILGGDLGILEVDLGRGSWEEILGARAQALL